MCTQYADGTLGTECTQRESTVLGHRMCTERSDHTLESPLQLGMLTKSQVAPLVTEGAPCLGCVRTEQSGSTHYVHIAHTVLCAHVGCCEIAQVQRERESLDNAPGKEWVEGVGEMFFIVSMGLPTDKTNPLYLSAFGTCS